MLRWVLTFFVIALIAGVLGFTAIAPGTTDIAQLVFYIFFTLLVITLALGPALRKKAS